MHDQPVANLIEANTTVCLGNIRAKAANFGISAGADVRRVLVAGADGAIIGSHLVRLSEDPEAYAQEVAAMCQGR